MKGLCVEAVARNEMCQIRSLNLKGRQTAALGFQSVYTVLHTADKNGTSQ